jgi:tRNA uridine 5-carboxymethylaminomethyl modification enzyme
VDGKTIDYSKTIPQAGDEVVIPFSFMNDPREMDQIKCYLTYTTKATHDVIRANLHRSALYGGQIVGIGPRYCPSIEDKVVRFADKERHQTFLEPEGLDTDEIYVQGMSSSLPEDVQADFYKTIIGLEDVKIVRPAYAIEYDCIESDSLQLSLEHRQVENLFCAGQFNGSSGYEEAAAQGLIAGINAVQKIRGREPLILDRSEAYIGVLIDDLVTKGVDEPYRMFTSRAEFRILLRQDNADQRLTPKGYELGLADEERYALTMRKYEAVEELTRYCDTHNLTPAQVNEYLASCGSAALEESKKISEVALRPELDLGALLQLVPRGTEDRKVVESVEITLKYRGYIDRERRMAEKILRLEDFRIPESFDFDKLSGLTIECRQKLKKYAPRTIAQASRISGVSPADISVLLIYAKRGFHHA